MRTGTVHAFRSGADGPSFAARLRLALAILTGGRWIRPVVRFPNGTEIDLSRGTILLPGDVDIHARGNLVLRSDRHVVVRSGASGGTTPGGRPWAVWLNPPNDGDVPTARRVVRDEDGNLRVEEYPYD